MKFAHIRVSEYFTFAKQIFHSVAISLAWRANFVEKRPSRNRLGLFSVQRLRKRYFLRFAIRFRTRVMLMKSCVTRWNPRLARMKSSAFGFRWNQIRPSSAARQISSQSDFIHHRWIYPAEGGFNWKNDKSKLVVFFCIKATKKIFLLVFRMNSNPCKNDILLRNMIYGFRRMIYLLRKHDIISVPSYAADIYHRS